MKRVFHPFWTWEEIQFGMWNNVSNVPEHLARAIKFTGDHVLYGSFMRRVTLEWPISCEHNLTDEAMNRKAWIGHAATALAISCPEHITRMAWGHLTEEQRDLANRQAQDAIDSWIATYQGKDSGLHSSMAAQRIFPWLAR